jgi:hypothetical protein
MPNQYTDPDAPVTPTPRFQIIASMRQGANYVLRDNLAGFDYPFKRLQTARDAIPTCRAKSYPSNLKPQLAGRFAGSPTSVDAYMASGPILESYVS